MREFDLLQHIFRSTRSDDARVKIGPGDDMAMLRLDGRDLLIAVDQIVDGRHVNVAHTPLDLIGRKAVTRSLSDVAAMAARPVASLAAVTLPPDFGSDRALALFDAIRNTAESFDCPLIGGDFALNPDTSNPLVCAVTVLAEPVAIPPITRGGAQAGDRVYVTGYLGGSLEPDGSGRHLTFEPRIKEAIALYRSMGDRLHSMIDLSDGLGRDAAHIAERSGVHIRLNAASIPCCAGCDWRRAMSDGEDYELCFTAAGAVPDRLGDLAVTVVGEVRASDSKALSLVTVHDGDVVIACDELGWQHESPQE